MNKFLRRPLLFVSVLAFFNLSLAASAVNIENNLKYILDHYAEGWLCILSNPSPWGPPRWQVLLSRTTLPPDAVQAITRRVGDSDPAYELLEQLFSHPDQPLSKLGQFISALEEMGLRGDRHLANARRYAAGQPLIPEPPLPQGPSVKGILDNFDSWRLLLNSSPKTGAYRKMKFWEILLEHTDSTFPRVAIYASLDPIRTFLRFLVGYSREPLSRLDLFLSVLERAGLRGDARFEYMRLFRIRETPLVLGGPGIGALFETDSPPLEDLILILNGQHGKVRRWEILLAQIPGHLSKQDVRESANPALALLELLKANTDTPLANLGYFLKELEFLGIVNPS